MNEAFFDSRHTTDFTRYVVNITFFVDVEHFHIGRQFAYFDSRRGMWYIPMLVK